MYSTTIERCFMIEASGMHRWEAFSRQAIGHVPPLACTVGPHGFLKEASTCRIERLDGLPVVEDTLGNLTVKLGSGRPRRLLACALDEAGYVVSHIREDGYLRLSRVGHNPFRALWDQSHEGQPVVVVTAQGLVPGAVGVKSIHLRSEGAETDGPFTLDQ